jgi:two-component sensor histidine kinase
MAERYKDIFRTENINRASAEVENASEISLKEKEIELLSRINSLNKEKIIRDELLRLAMLRENQFKDSSLANQLLLLTAADNEAALRKEQLNKEKELSLSLSRENELKQKLLTDERSNKKILWIGLGLMTILGLVIFLQYQRQKRKNTIINKQSDELAVLNKEIHHRVKNNLQVISSMLDLQSQSLNDEKATAIIKEGIQRVQSMAFIHQNLYQGDAVNSVNMNEYIKTLSNHLFQTYNIRPDKIKLHTQIENLNLHTDTAIPLGMILNELTSNSLKYAFKGKETGDIWVIMKKNDNELLLQVKDNGVGLPAGFNPYTTSSFGYEIIKAFSQKMKARMNIDGTNGTDVQIIISKFKTTA